MIKHQWSILCKSAIVDRETNNLSLFSVLEKIKIGQLSKKDKSESKDKTQVYFPFELVTMWWRSESGKQDEQQVRIKVIDPDKTELMRNELEVIMKKGIKNLRTRIKFNTLELTKSGLYYFKIQCKKNNKWNKVQSLPLQIELT